MHVDLQQRELSALDAIDRGESQGRLLLGAGGERGDSNESNELHASLHDRFPEFWTAEILRHLRSKNARNRVKNPCVGWITGSGSYSRARFSTTAAGFRRNR